MRLLDRYIHNKSKALSYDYSTDYLFELLISRLYLCFALNGNFHKHTSYVVKSAVVGDFQSSTLKENYWTRRFIKLLKFYCVVSQLIMY